MKPMEQAAIQDPSLLEQAPNNIETGSAYMPLGELAVLLAEQSAALEAGLRSVNPQAADKFRVAENFLRDTRTEEVNAWLTGGADYSRSFIGRKRSEYQALSDSAWDGSLMAFAAEQQARIQKEMASDTEDEDTPDTRAA